MTIADPRDHEQILRAATVGDAEALDALIRLYHDRVFRFGTRVCRDRFDAGDAVQGAFLKLARRPEVVRDAKALGWLLEVVKNTCIRLAQRALRLRTPLAQLELDEIEDPALELSPDEALDRWRLVDAVHRAIALLESEERAVVVLRDLEGLSGEQVSQRLGLSTAAMKSRLHRGRSRVRAFVEEEQRTASAPNRVPGGRS